MTRFGYAMTTCFAAMAIGVGSLFPTAPRLIWNASASVPVGLYALRGPGRLQVGELVAVRPPEPLAGYMANRRYLPKRVFLLKHILALAGQTVCRRGAAITVDNRAVGAALARDRRGRILPVWRGCRVIRPGEVFLMNRAPRDSFDGRYFGPLPVTSIVGEATPIWTLGAP